MSGVDVPSAGLRLLAPPVSATPSAASRIALLRVDRGLCAAIPPDQVEEAERFLLAPVLRLAAGPWNADAAMPREGGYRTVLVVDGLMTLDVTLADRTISHLFTAGDPLRPWDRLSAVLPVTAGWSVGRGGATVALLEARFARAEQQWPALRAVIQERFAEQAAALVVRTAIAALPRVGQRVVGLLWQLADRWGTVRPEGVVINLALTHELLGRLVGARRPTVSLALRDLAADGLLTRTASRAWLLSHSSHAILKVGTRAVRAPGVSTSTRRPVGV
ncbi:MAG: family transcriptional regulator, cyclic receptor protein [Solirubrobacteraceae bacterium]|jgi:hypothetical protein|nr:family transcriptional regulator, cyclic receptor protein [Solirubrobacteraceae bacterium]